MKVIIIFSLCHSEGDGGAYNFTTVGVEGGSVTTATLAGLRPHARYTVVLQAFNSRGAGPASPPALGTTLQDSEYTGLTFPTSSRQTHSTLSQTHLSPLLP